MGARETALRVLAACRNNNAWADAALKAQLNRDGLVGADAALCSRMAYGVMQNQLLLDFYLAAYCSQKPDHLQQPLTEILRLGAYQILFLDAATDELINRYKITRRPHPLMGKSDSLSRAINQERELLRQIKERADMVIDTTLLSAAQLRSNIHDLFRSNDPDKDDFVVNCISFGFKFGVPVDADLMFDVRCLPNPFYDPNLRPMTGLDEPVQQFVLDSQKTQGFLTRLYDFIDYMIPLYRHDEKKSQLVIAVGCTGGKHRSVTIARELSQHLHQQGLRVITSHRDIEKKKL